MNNKFSLDTRSEMELRARFDALRLPKFCTWELTSKCNFTCLHCYNRDISTPDLTTQEVFLVADKLKESGVHSIALTGGEIFLRKDIFEIIEYLNLHRFHIELFTNASLITNEIAARLAEMNIQRVEVSVYASSKEGYQRITQNQKGYSMTIKGLEALRNNHLNVYIKTVALSYNYAELQGIRDLAIKMGCEVAGETAEEMADPRIFASTVQQRLTRMNDDEMRSFFESFSDLHGKPYGPCGAGASEFAISSNGDVLPCILWRNRVMGNLLDESLSEIMRSLKAEEIKMVDFEKLKCYSCVDRDFCYPCLMSNEIESENICSPAEETCRIARIRHSIFDERNVDQEV